MISALPPVQSVSHAVIFLALFSAIAALGFLGIARRNRRDDD